MGYILFSKTQMKVVIEIKIAICRARETLLNPHLGDTAQPPVPPVPAWHRLTCSLPLAWNWMRRTFTESHQNRWGVHWATGGQGGGIHTHKGYILGGSSCVCSL